MAAPNPTYDEMRDMFRAHTAAAVKVIVDIMSGAGGKGDAVRLSAAKEILNRGWGKPEAEKAKKGKETPPDYRGKALTQIVAEEAAAAGRDPPWGKTPPPPVPRDPAPVETAPAPPLPPAPPPRDNDPTGYRAKRALWSAPTGKG
jgi:hypothetical protein